jgi:hypothetical protein
VKDTLPWAGYVNGPLRVTGCHAERIGAPVGMSGFLIGSTSIDSTRDAVAGSNDPKTYCVGYAIIFLLDAKAQ